MSLVPSGPGNLRNLSHEATQQHSNAATQQRRKRKPYASFPHGVPVTSPARQEDAKPTRDEFAQRVRAYLIGAGLCVDAAFNSEQFALICRAENEWDGLTLLLANAYEDYCQVDENEREQVIVHYFGQDEGVPDSLEEALPNILPHLQARGSFEVLKLTPKPANSIISDEEAEIPIVELAHHFQLSLVFDTPKSMSHLNQKTIKNWSISFDNLMEKAMANLAERTPDPFKEITPGIYCSPYSDSHDATRVILMDRVQECRVKGRHLAFTPNRESLLITGDEDEAGLAIVSATVFDIMQNPRPLPSFPLVLDKGEWKLWQVPTFHPAAQAIANIINFSLNDIYGLQKAVLDMQHQNGGIDLFVGSFKALQREGSDEILSVCSWGQGVPTLLPLTESINFVAAKGDVFELLFAAPFEIALQIVGDRMKKVAIYPDRYFVDTFPTEGELHKIRTLAERAGSLIT